MEFGYTEKQEELRKEMREFLEKELPSDYAEANVREDEAIEKFNDEFQKKGVKKGYPAAGWPKKYGGMGLGALDQGVLAEEANNWGVRWGKVAEYFLLGPTIMVMGTEEQKARFLPPIIRGESVGFQAYTEPNAGSDEANMELRGVQDGDYWVLNGQKTFITGTVKPDWLFTLVRTAETLPKHRGITLFMVEANSPGVTYRPLETMAGSRQNEIFYDNVRVPKNNVIGEVNRGFYAAMATFEFERAAVVVDARRGLRKLVEFCRKEKRNGKALIKDPEVRKYLAAMAMHQQARHLTTWYSVWHSANRAKLGPSRYDLNAFLEKSWRPDGANGMMDVLDMYGQLEPTSKYAKYEGLTGQWWENSRILHPAGTPEILKVVLGNRGLGLPRIPRKFNAMIAAELGKE
ncbi:MAG: acyl-CoA dehydrogenase family protein [Dehalococcoidales bacterium]|nr:acyl-CoA dehydrogenase family protein [Dehalococcoidales bacterium]